MKLFNKAIDNKLFKQYSFGSDLSKQKVVAKIFNPYGNGTWYILNSDPNDPDYLWAIVDLGYGAEVGSVSRSDLETYRNRMRLGFERDMYFDEINAKELYNGLLNGESYDDGGDVSNNMYEENINTSKFNNGGKLEMELAGGGFVNWRKNPDKKVLGFYSIKGSGIEVEVNLVNFERADELNYSLYPSNENRDYFTSIDVKSNTLNSLSKGLGVKGVTNDGKSVTIKRLKDISFDNGGSVKPFEYKENNAEIMINGTKADVKKMYLDYVNNFLSVGKFAEHYQISEKQANSIIEQGRKYAKEDGYYATGGYMTDPNFGSFQNQVYAEKGATVDNTFNYMMLSRLKSDCDYYLGYGNRSEKVLWASNVDDHIDEMKRLWNSFPKNEKPEWLTMEEILDYENKMKRDNYANGGKLESKIKKKVDEVNSLIEKAIDSDGDPIMVVDKSGTWEEPMQYKPIVYKNGRLYFEYYEPYSDKTKKEVVNKSNIDFDGYPMLLDIAKMYRIALKEKGVSYAGGGQIKAGDDVKIIESYWSNKKEEEFSENEFKKYIEKNQIKNIWIGLKKIDYFKFDLHEGRMIMRYALRKNANLKYYVSFLNHSVALKNNNAVFLEDKNYENYKNRILTKETLELLNTKSSFYRGGKTTFKEKATAIAKNFEGKKVEPKYQKEYGKTYDKAEAKEVGNKIAGSQKANYDSKMSKGGSTKRGGAMVLAKQIRKDGESWQSALKRANQELKK